MIVFYGPLNHNPLLPGDIKSVKSCPYEHVQMM